MSVGPLSSLFLSPRPTLELFHARAMSPSTSASTYPNAQVKATFPSTGVLLLTLARPPVNAVNNSLWFELGKSFDVASVDVEVRVVVLNSELEKVCTAGLDLGWVSRAVARAS